MTTRGGTFDPDGAKRIIGATKKLENQIPHTGLKYNRAGKPTLSNNGFWAEITFANLVNGKYAWTKLRPQDEEDFDQYESPFVDDTEWGEGKILADNEGGYAREINGSTQVVMKDKVYIEPNGIHGYYTFNYQPDIKIVKVDDDIPARSGTEISFSLGKFYRHTDIDSYNATLEQVPIEQSIKFFNLSGGIVEKDKYLMAAYVDRFWHIIYEDCSV